MQAQVDGRTCRWTEFEIRGQRIAETMSFSTTLSFQKIFKKSLSAEIMKKSIHSLELDGINWDSPTPGYKYSSMNMKQNCGNVGYLLFCQFMTQFFKLKYDPNTFSCCDYNTATNSILKKECRFIHVSNVYTCIPRSTVWLA